MLQEMIRCLQWSTCKQAVLTGWISGCLIWSLDCYSRCYTHITRCPLLMSWSVHVCCIDVIHRHTHPFVQPHWCNLMCRLQLTSTCNGYQVIPVQNATPTCLGFMICNAFEPLTHAQIYEFVTGKLAVDSSLRYSVSYLLLLYFEPKCVQTLNC